MERRVLQVTLGLLSLIPLLGLALIWTRGAAAFGALESAVPTALDNQLRYLAGVYFGTVTIPLWWAIPRIEARGQALVVAATGDDEEGISLWREVARRYEQLIATGTRTLQS